MVPLRIFGSITLGTTFSMWDYFFGMEIFTGLSWKNHSMRDYYTTPSYLDLISPLIPGDVHLSKVG